MPADREPAKMWHHRNTPVMGRRLFALYCFALLIFAAPLWAQVSITTDSPLPAGTVGVAYSQAFAASGGIAPYTWSLAPGSDPLPAGLILSGSGILSGTPTAAGTFNFTVRATDASPAPGQSATKAFALTINPAPLTITTASPLPEGTVGAAYSQTLAAEGGTPAYTWALATGSNPLPAGLTLSGAGVIAGTPTIAGSYTFTVEVTDSGALTPQSTTKAFALTINPAPVTITTSSPLPVGTVGAAYSQTFAATGGVAPYSWDLAPGSDPLPAGLTLSMNGILSGTPTVAGTFTFTIRVTENSPAPGQSATKAFSLSINIPPLIITTASPLPVGTVGVSYSQTLVAEGGTPAYTWAPATGSDPLPPGLSLFGAGILSGTPTTAGTYTFTVQVTDSGAPTPQSATKQFTLTINPPALVITTATPLPVGTVGVSYSQTLVAEGGTPAYTWALATGSNPLPVGISLSGAGVLAGTPTAAGTYTFTVQVTDSGAPTPQSVTKQFTLTINPPALVITTATPLPVGTVGVAYSQTLAAEGGTPAYTWALATGSNPLPVGISLSGAGVLAGTPTAAGTYTFTVQVTDSGAPTPQSVTKQFTLTINPPALVITTATPLPGGTVGVAYSQTLAAEGGTPAYTWAPATGSDPLPAGLSLSGAGVLAGTPTTAGTFTFTVQVTDSGAPTPQSVTKQFTLTINPPPLVIVSTSPLPGGVVGAAYSQTLAAEGGTPGYSWALAPGSNPLPGGLSLSPGGVLAGTPTTAGAYTFTVQVTDSGAPAPQSASKQFTLTINPAPLVITTNSLPDGIVGVGYSQTLAANGGTTPYSWTVSAGTVPPGLTLLGNGELSGTPTTPGSFSFSVQVNSQDGQNATRAFTVNILAGLSITTASALPEGERGTAYTLTFAAAGGTPPYANWTVTAGALPPGLILAPATGVLSGTPTAAGDYSFTVQVRDSASLEASKAFALHVRDPLTITTTSPLPAGTVGTAYAQTIAASGGTPGYTFTVSVGSLPPGLTLLGNGNLWGTPLTTGTFNFTVEVRDSAFRSASKAFSVEINPPPLEITTAALPDGRVAVAYAQTFTAAGGTPPYTWSVASGSLPAGLSLSNAGSLSGTPTTAGASSFTVRVTDAGGRNATRALTLTILPAGLAITTQTLAQGTVGVAYAAALQGSGGTPPYSWSVVSGTLPAGISLTQGGQLSGTPTAAGTFNFTVRLQDSLGEQTTRALSLVIAPPPLTILTNGPLPRGFLGNPYSQTLSATGGTPPYAAWSVIVGALPAGLNLAAATGVISGTPTAVGVFTFTVELRDAAAVTAQKELQIQVLTGVEITSPSLLPGAVVGVAYSFALAAEGGAPAYSWSITSGALPPGLALNTATGVISGTPTTSGTYSFTIRALDSQSVFGTKSFTLDVTTGLSVTTPSSLPGGSTGSAYSQTLVAQGGTAPYSWTLMGGSLPGGLNLSVNGVVFGTPAVTGTFRFTVRVTDANARSTTKEFELTVVAASTLEITTTSLPNGRVGVAYSQTLAASGGSGALTWTLSGGSLPAGLMLSAGGVLSGTPTTPGQSQFTVSARDASGASVSRQLTMQVLAGPAIVSSGALPRGIVGQPYSQQLAAEGGQTPYAWRLTAGSNLPAGLALSSGGLLSGTPTAPGAFSFALTVTDAAGGADSRSFTLTILPELPPVTITGLPASAESAQQLTLGLTIPSGYPETLSGRLVLEFQPDAVHTSDDPAVQFSSGGRTVSFTIPANSTQGVFPASPLGLQTGTVAGAIVVRLEELRLTGMDVTPALKPSQTTRVNRAAPVIRSMTLTRTAAGFEVRIVGFSNPRALTQATFRFTGGAGGNLQTTQIDLPLTEPANEWFAGSASRQFGSQFTLTVPFTISGPAGALASVSATLANGQGASNSVSVNY